MEILNEPPKSSSFTPLAEHQSATPVSFYNGPPVLHYYSDRCKLVVLDSEYQSDSALSTLVSKAEAAKAPQTGTNGSSASTQEVVNGTDEEEQNGLDGRKTLEDMDVWVTSDKLLIYSQPAQIGVSIPYPSISLHAIQSLPRPNPTDTTSQGLYMQIISSVSTSNPSDDEIDMDSISVTIIPTASSPPVPLTQTTTDDAVLNEDQPESTPVQAMFDALSACSNLHPDPAQDGDEMDAEGGAFEGSAFYQAGLLQPGINDGSGGLPLPMPGSGGWITAENMHEYFNAEGEYIGPGAGDGTEDDGMDQGDEEGNGTTNTLGPGAGQVRNRDADGMVDDQDETKWRRTE